VSFKVGDVVLITKYWTGRVGVITKVGKSLITVDEKYYEIETVGMGTGGFYFGDFTLATELIKALM